MITINDNLVKAISWTLVHSVWQGFLLAILAGMVIVATNKSTSALRYNLFCGLFIIFLMIVGITFNYEFANGADEVTTRLNLPIQNHFNVLVDNNTSIPLSDYLINYLNNHADVIVLLWLLVFSVRCFQVFGCLNRIYRVRNYKTQQPPEYWTTKLDTLCGMLNIQIPVTLLESPLVKVPSVTGFFKPIILIPIGLLSNLPHDQMEAILLHELAHIRRKDYFVNVMQCLAETLFFFNPGLLWLSSLIKEERENCCDDIAISVMENKGKLVHALVSFEEYNMKNVAPALAFGSKKKHLLNRAKRIIHNDNKSLNVIEKTFLSISLLIIAIVVLACTNAKMAEEYRKEEVAKADREAVRADVEAQEADARAHHADMEAHYADMEAQNADVESIDADRKAKEADLKAMAEDAKVSAAEAAAMKADMDAMKQARIAGIVQSPAPIQCTPVAPLSITTSTTQSQTVRTTTTDTKTDKSYERESVNGKQRVHVKTGITGENLPEKVNVDYFTDHIISDLVAEKVIQCSTNLSFKLSAKNLIVNGVVQPQKVFSKLKARYLKDNMKFHSICYNYEIN